MAKFTVPMDCSVSWQWPVGGPFYTMSMRDSARLDAAYNGPDPRGPTHAEKLAIIERLQWETCPNGHGMIYVRAPR